MQLLYVFPACRVINEDVNYYMYSLLVMYPCVPSPPRRQLSVNRSTELCNCGQHVTTLNRP